MGKGFEDLELYREARILRVRVFKLAKLLPDHEKWALAQQMRRAALSVTNNIAEGHGSKSFKHNISYLYRSRGSTCELQDDLNTCDDERYFQSEHLNDLRKQSETVLRLLNGYIRHLRVRMAQDESE